jgi:TetR/AcrR family transcriptional regulator, transcriptional repressor of aconitase
VSRVTQAHVDARTDSIVHAAMKSFVDKGIEAATVQDIATEAGISAGAIYRYFPGKEHVLRGVLEHFHEENRQMFAAVRAVSTTPLEALERAAFYALDKHEDKANCALWMEMSLASWRYGLTKERIDCWTDVGDHIEELVREAQEAGQIDPSLDSHGVALLFLATVKGMMALTFELNGSANKELFKSMIKEMVSRFAPAATLASTI